MARRAVFRFGNLTGISGIHVPPHPAPPAGPPAACRLSGIAIRRATVGDELAEIRALSFARTASQLRPFPAMRVAILSEVVPAA